MSRWQRYRRLAPEDRRTLLQALILLPLTALGLRVFGLRRVRLLMEDWNGKSHGVSSVRELGESALRAAHMVAAASREGLVEGNCLSQSLVLWLLLRRAGTAPDLRIGVQRDSELLKAHAWVELQGAILNDSADIQQRYTPFEGDIAAAQIRMR